MINFTHGGVDYSADNNTGLLAAMKDLGMTEVTATYTFMGMSGYTTKLTLSEVKELAREHAKTKDMTDKDFFDHYKR